MFETITPSTIKPDYEDIKEWKDEFYPFKESDNITIINNKDEHPYGHELFFKGNKIEFKSENTNKSFTLQYAIDRDEYDARGFYSSKVVKENK